MSINFHHPGFLWFWIIKVEASNVTLREELDRFALEDFIFCNIFIFLLANFAKFANSLENTNTRFRQNFEVEKANWLDEKEKVNFQKYFHSVFSDFFTMLCYINTYWSTITLNYNTVSLKVIRYQKQLQLNYVQMYKRNKTLESEVGTKIQIPGTSKQIPMPWTSKQIQMLSA